MKSHPVRRERYGRMIRAALLLLLAGCTSHVVAPAAAGAPAEDPAAFARGEDEILRDLSAIDRRFARRAHLTPSEDDLRRVSMAALLHEDPSLAVNDGAIDPFSFDARARGLDAVKAKLAKLPAGGGVERELLGRVVDAEVARLDEERLLPRSASSLIHAIVDNWTPPKDEREAADDDRWLARRLAEVRASMTTVTDPNASLDVVRARELDDVLDAFERLAAGLVKTTQELVKTREALESIGSQPAAKAHSDWDLVAKRLGAAVGRIDDADGLAAALAKLEADLRARTAAAPASERVATNCAPASSPLLACMDPVHDKLLVMGTCTDAVPGSPLRSMAAPAEREPACHLRKVLPDFADAQRLELLHAHVVVAQWALDVARGQATIAETEGRHQLITPPRFDVRARLERVALARPAAAIAGGLAVRLLVEGDPAARAKAWQALGDVPFDIAERELR